MHIRELTIDEFTKFQENHPLTNYHQTINYAILMSESGYNYDLIGYVNEEDEILAASLILIKHIGIKTFYGYAPRGFLIDYEDDYLLTSFLNSLKNYYYNRNVAFIKINPNVKINEIDANSFESKNLLNKDISSTLISNGCKKLKNNLYFEAQLPRFEAIINLEKDSFNNYQKNTKNKIKKGLRKGLILEKCNQNQIGIFTDFIKFKKNFNDYYYNDYYTVFNKNNNIDLFLVKINYEEFLENSEFLYNKELEKNNILNEKLARSSSEKIINAKMASDKNILTYKNEIMEATNGFSLHKEEYLAGALVIKHNDTATIVMSGYDKKYKRFSPNYFLHYNLIKHYKNQFQYLNFNGVVGDFTNENPYSGLNRFKLGFNPKIYEYIGEYDLVINKKIYDILLRNNVLAKEFNKLELKK